MRRKILKIYSRRESAAAAHVQCYYNAVGCVVYDGWYVMVRCIYAMLGFRRPVGFVTRDLLNNQNTVGILLDG